MTIFIFLYVPYDFNLRGSCIDSDSGNWETLGKREKVLSKTQKPSVKNFVELYDVGSYGPQVENIYNKLLVN